jgi:hypothetical protein
MQNQLNKGQQELLEEAKIRGLCAAHSADMEALLLRLILYCIVDDPSVAYRKFSKMTLGSKILWAQKDLLKYYPEKHALHEQDFEWLWQFNDYRGRLIHGDIIWIPNDFNNFYVMAIEEINGEWKITPIHHTKVDVVKKLVEFGKVIINFANTAKDIIQIVEIKYPELNKSHKS